MWRARSALVALVAAVAVGGCSAGSGPATTQPAPAPRPQASGFTVGISAGGAPTQEAQIGSELRPAVVRVEFDIGTPVSEIAPTIAALAARGERVQLLASFVGTLPGDDGAPKVAAWAHAFGPGGSFWRGRSDGRLAVRYIEFGNETSGGSQYDGCGPGCPDWAARATQYAERFKQSQEAIDSPQGNPRVGLLAIADDSGDPAWDDAMYSAVPDLNSRVAGWIEHPYGPDYKQKIRRLLVGVGAHGGGDLPIFVTEFGIATDNGRCLDDNYGWPKCLTYQQTAALLRGAIADMRSTFGRRLAEVLIFSQVDGRPSGSTADREAYFGIVQQQGQPKGALTDAVQAILNTYRG